MKLAHAHRGQDYLLIPSHYHHARIKVTGTGGRPGGTQQGVEGRITRGELGAGNPAPWGPGGPDKPPAARLGREEQQHQEAHTQPRTRHPHARGHTTPQTRGHITPPHPACTSSATWSHTHHTSARSSAHLLAHSLPMHCTPPIPHGSPGALFVLKPVGSPRVQTLHSEDSDHQWPVIGRFCSTELIILKQMEGFVVEILEK